MIRNAQAPTFGSVLYRALKVQIKLAQKRNALVVKDEEEELEEKYIAAMDTARDPAEKKNRGMCCLYVCYADACRKTEKREPTTAAASSAPSECNDW